ncbi:MAG: hypothetical protein PHQ23_06865 [Candidatus Wallbacteria bacterium]|nr:hypothetical protein [Candidatus Wallbacteria bacterium]
MSEAMARRRKGRKSFRYSFFSLLMLAVYLFLFSGFKLKIGRMEEEPFSVMLNRHMRSIAGLDYERNREKSDCTAAVSQQADRTGLPVTVDPEPALVTVPTLIPMVVTAAPAYEAKNAERPETLPPAKKSALRNVIPVRVEMVESARKPADLKDLDAGLSPKSESSDPVTDMLERGSDAISRKVDSIKEKIRQRTGIDIIEVRREDGSRVYTLGKNFNAFTVEVDQLPQEWAFRIDEGQISIDYLKSLDEQVRIGISRSF